METLNKSKKTHDEVIKYLIERKKETIAEREAFSKTENFQEIRKKLKALNKF